MAKNHFSRFDFGSYGVFFGGFGGEFVLKSGLRILIRAPEVPFLVPSNWIKRGVLAITLFTLHNITLCTLQKMI